MLTIQPGARRITAESVVQSCSRVNNGSVRLQLHGLSPTFWDNIVVFRHWTCWILNLPHHHLNSLYHFTMLGEICLGKTVLWVSSSSHLALSRVLTCSIFSLDDWFAIAALVSRPNRNVAVFVIVNTVIAIVPLNSSDRLGVIESWFRQTYRRAAKFGSRLHLSEFLLGPISLDPWERIH